MFFLQEFKEIINKVNYIQKEEKKISPMRKYIFLFLSIVLFSLVSCDISKLMKGDWYKEYLISDTTDDMAYSFDLIVGYIFMRKKGYSEIFSPLGLDYNILIQRANGYFGLEHIGIAQKEIEKLNSKLDKTNRNIFNTSSRLDIEEPLTNNGDLRHGYLYNLISNDNEFIIQRNKWIDEQMNNLFEPTQPKDYSYISKDCVFTITYFKDSLVEPFDKNNYTEEEFMSYASIYSDPSTREFKNIKHKFKYSQANVKERKFHIVALPYKETNSNGVIRYIVYLIPKEGEYYRGELVKLWDDFSTRLYGNIKDTIIKLKEQEIYLSIPLIKKHRTLSSYLGNFKDIIKYRKDDVDSVRISFINAMDEEIEEKIKLPNNAMNYEENIPFVCGNIPYISFIFDMQLERMLFISKDYGK